MDTVQRRNKMRLRSQSANGEGQPDYRSRQQVQGVLMLLGTPITFTYLCGLYIYIIFGNRCKWAMVYEVRRDGFKLSHLDDVKSFMQAV